jgi:hypothetical protein
VIYITALFLLVEEARSWLCMNLSSVIGQKMKISNDMSNKNIKPQSSQRCENRERINFVQIQRAAALSDPPALSDHSVPQVA